MSKINYEDAVNIKGWLDKRSPSLFKGYQKRFFFILDKRFFVYSNSEGSEVKGSIDLANAVIDGNLKNVKNFNVTFSDREFQLKAENEKEKEKWVVCLRTIALKLNESQVNTREPSNSQNWKIKNVDVEALKAIQKSGMINDKNLEDSKKCYDIKGLMALFRNVDQKILENRQIYGFLDKRHKSTVTMYQRRWLYLISSRPLLENEYVNQELQLESKILPSFISFDTIYYYEFDSESDNSEAKGKIPLNECHGVKTFEEDDKYCINIDLGDRKFEFTSSMKGERDRWFEAIKLSRKTAKDYKNSFTKRPRNTTRIKLIKQNEGIDKIKAICEKEKSKYLPKEEINSLDMLEFLFENLGDFLLQTVDGCLLDTPPNQDIITVYSESVNEELISQSEGFWKRNFEKLNSSDLVNFGCLLQEYYDKIIKIGIKDTNFIVNSTEIFKIYGKSTFSAVKDLMDEVIRRMDSYFEHEDIYVTHSPTDIFKILHEILDLIKPKKNSKLIENFLVVVKESTLRFLIAVEYFITRKQYIIDNELLIAISNNRINFLHNLTNLIDEAKKDISINETDFEDSFKLSDIFKVLNQINVSCYTKICEENFGPIIDHYKVGFMELDMEKTIQFTFNHFRLIVSKIHFDNLKMFWKETLEINLFLYINRSLFKNKSKIRSTNQITDKIKKDRDILIDQYRDHVGSNVCTESVRIIECILDFLETSIDMIAISCSNQRKIYGDAFSIHTAKALINLRVDLSSSEKKEAIATCSEYIEKMDKNVTAQGKSALNSRILSMIDQSENDDGDNDQLIEAESSEDFFEKTKVMDLNSFLGSTEDEATVEETDEEDKKYFVKSEKIFEDKDDVICGFMEKKSYSKWQERYFQLKNGFLYWYKDDKSREALNSIKIKDVSKVEEYKECNFALTLEDEKMYKFKVESSEVKEKWMNAIKIEMKKLRNDQKNKWEIIFETKQSKKVINNLLGLQPIGRNKREVYEIVDVKLKNEGKFKRRPTKLQNLAFSVEAIKQESATGGNPEISPFEAPREQKEESFLDSFKKLFCCCFASKKKDSLIEN